MEWNAKKACFPMARSTDKQTQRLVELKREVLKRGYDRHASVLKCVSELPVEFQSSVANKLLNNADVQTIVLFPAQIQRGWHYVPKQALLFTPTGFIHLLASIWPEQEPQVICLDGCSLLYLKATLLLLYGYLEIVAQGPGSPVRLGMEFNTVSWNLISAPLRQFLKASKTSFRVPTDQVAYAPNTRQVFRELPFKFFNGVQLYGLLPGEELEELVFQEATWKRWLYFFRRPDTADTLLMLTSNYMVVIQEDLNVRQGWILSYIPRNSICGIQSQPKDIWNELSVRLQRGDQEIDYTLLVAGDAVEAWRRQWIQHGGQWQDIP
jgi:hypothetical protein